MRLGATILVASAVGVLCAGCDGLAGTASFREAKAERAVSEQLIDPTAAQFRNVQSQGDSVCGEVNAKNKMGAYVGYTRFVVETTTYDALIDPQFDLSDLLSARDLCTEMSSNEYSSASATVSACGRVSDLEAQQTRQATFDDRWAKHCEGFVGRDVYRPPLQTTQPADEQNAFAHSASSEMPTEAPEQAQQVAPSDTEADEPDSDLTETSVPRSPTNDSSEPTQEELNRAFPPQAPSRPNAELQP